MHYSPTTIFRFEDEQFQEVELYLRVREQIGLSRKNVSSGRMTDRNVALVAASTTRSNV